MKTNSNDSLNAIIKLRHLSKSIKTNWKTLEETKENVFNIIEEAGLLMKNYGSTIGKSKYQVDAETLQKKIAFAQNSLNEFYAFIIKGKKIESEKQYHTFMKNLDETKLIFEKIGAYPKENFSNLNPDEWKDIWEVVMSNIYIVQGVGEAAFMKVRMLENFNQQESDLLTSEIVKHIPESFSLLEAAKYKDDYLKAVKEIEEEANKNDHLWDRFLNILAGGIPFKQTPAERVMMSRWLEGEKGEL